MLNADLLSSFTARAEGYKNYIQDNPRCLRSTGDQQSITENTQSSDDDDDDKKHQPKMPLFEISHVAPLTKAQKDEMALAITNLQCSKFGTPSLFVTVIFTATTASDAYVAGKSRPLNIIHITFRDGPMHTQPQFDSLCLEIQTIWSSVVVHPSHPTSTGPPPPELSLAAVYVTGAILTALEAGFIVPKPGQEKEWAMGNMEAFKLRARDGDEDIRGLLEELQRRMRPAA